MHVTGSSSLLLKSSPSMPLAKPTTTPRKSSLRSGGIIRRITGELLSGLTGRRRILLCIQHEYGIYGGLAGDYLFTLLRDVKKPVVTTMHTVLKDSLPEYEAATHELVKHSHLLVVMSQVSKKILMERYGVSQEKIALVYHGVPDMPLDGGSDAKRRLGLDGRFVVLTFGLLSQNKGIETAIEGCPGGRKAGGPPLCGARSHAP